MNTSSIITLLFGVGCIGYGCYTAYIRSTDPDKFGKLQAMREQWGVSAGTAMHVVSYTLVPILVGLCAVVLAFLGKSVF